MVRPPATLLFLLVAAGCGTGASELHRFHGPIDVAYLPPGPFFEQPVAYVTNWQSGTVSKLDLRRFDMLVEDEPGAWIASPPMAAGRDRVLDQVAVATDLETFVDVLATDASRDEILRLPHLEVAGDGTLSFFGDPVVSAGPEYHPGEGSGGGEVTLAGLALLEGATATEEWTLTWRGSAWTVDGTASGPQVEVALPGVPYATDRDELRFTVVHGDAVPAEGSTVVLSTDTGLRSAPLSGYAHDLLAVPGGRWVLAAVQATGPGGEPAGVIEVWDRTLEIGAVLELPEGARPAGMGLDREGTSALVADLSDLGVVHRVHLEGDDPVAFVVEQVPVPGPTVDVAVGRSPERELLFAASLDEQVVHLVDLGTGEPVDWNPYTPEPDPIQVRAPVVGLAASAEEIDLNTEAPWGAPERAPVVVATTLTGFLHVLDAATGCAAFESVAGAYVQADASGSYSPFTDLSPPSNPAIEVDPETGAVGTTNSCGGITLDEYWTLTYDESLQSYTVEGRESGEQVGRLYEDVRYVSDGGEISLLVRSGTLATTDGDRFVLDVNDGLSPVPLQELPGDPLVYTDRFGDRTSPWYNVATREAAVVPHAGNDVVMWIDIQGYGDGGLQYFQ